MRTIRTWPFKVMAFVLVVLVAIGAWEILQGKVRPSPAQTVVFDHLYCYSITPAHTQKDPVTVQDQFHPNREALTVKVPKFLCTPADKNPDGGPPGPTNQVHYMCYTVTPQHNHAKHVIVKDQFHPSGEDFKVTFNRMLCAPAEKTLVN